MAAAVLSGNRNFEGRINPLVKANYLASPPLVVAYALAGTTDIDLINEPLGRGTDGKDVFLKDIWPTAEEVQTHDRRLRAARDVPSSLYQRDDVERKVEQAADQRGRPVRLGRRRARTFKSRRFWSTSPREPGKIQPLARRRVSWPCWATR